MARTNRPIAGVPPRWWEVVVKYLRSRDFSIGVSMLCPVPRSWSSKGSNSGVKRKRCLRCNNICFWNVAECTRCKSHNFYPRRH